MREFGMIVIVSTLGLLIVCLALYARIQRKRHFLCPRCGARFKVPGMRSFFVSRRGTDRLLTCPNCGISAYMENIHDEEYEKELAEKQGQEEENETENDQETEQK